MAQERSSARPLPTRRRRVTSCDVPTIDGLGWLPAEGTTLTRDELVEMFIALRALISGTEPDEPNRAHAVTIASILSSAIDRPGGGQ